MTPAPVHPDPAAAAAPGRRSWAALAMAGAGRLTFRQLLIVAFLLVAGLMAGATLRGLLTLEGLTAQSRADAEQSARLQAGLQVLAERSLTMERAARQYLVLDDRMLRQRFAAAAEVAGQQVQTLVDLGELPEALARPWHAQLRRITALVDRPPAEVERRDPALVDAFRQLETAAAAIADRLYAQAQARTRAQLAELEAGRLAIGRQIIAASLFALLLALGFGVALARPLQRLEAAIADLGDNRLDTAIEIRGPADVRRLGQRLDWLRQRLAELDADKARFLRQVSHELKTPLAALREGVALLEDGVTGALNEPQREVARILRENTARLQAQIEDLLRFNAAAFAARQLVRQRVELAGWLTGIVETQRLQWLGKRLAVQVEGDPAWVAVDPDKLAIAVGNLLSNAIRFSPPQGRIAIVLGSTPNAVAIDVVDEGPGVAADDRPHVFEAFYRGQRQPADGLRGSGIGLSIVREIVAAHGGRVALLAGGSGACFRIELPHADAI